MNAIVNVNQSFGIGKGGDLLVYLPEDMKFFRTQTKGKTLIMGRKTLMGFPGAKPLKGRRNIVLTGSRESLPEETLRFETPAEDGTALLVVPDVETLMQTLSALALPEDEIYVIGGEQVYRELFPFCNTCYVTINDSDREADTWFPDLSQMPDWQCTEESEEAEYEGIRYRFTIYRRVGERNDS